MTQDTTAADGQGRMRFVRGRRFSLPNRRRLLQAGLVLLALGVLGLIYALVINRYIVREGSKYIVEPEAAPHADAILVLGARVFPDGGVSTMLGDRLDVGLKLYQAGKSNRILVSGDHGRTHYDEVNTMKSYLKERGVPGDQIFMDHAGFSTYESMYRARDIFQVHKVIIVTQRYHLLRAVYSARRMGLEAYGVASDLQRYRGIERFELREILARNKDFLWVNLWRPKPTYLGDVIPVWGSGAQTDDKK